MAIINGTDANTLLTAQLAVAQRQPAQDPAAAQARDQQLQVQRQTRNQNAQAPQTSQAVLAADTETSGQAAASRPDLPRDAQANARAATERNGDRPPRRGSAVDVYA